MPDHASEKLLPCPFCGDPVRMCPTSRETFQVLCCGCGTLSGCHQESDGAAAAWNRRTPSAAEARMRAKMEQIAAWIDGLERQARFQAEQNRGRFDTLADACDADAKNYAATAKDIRAALRPEEQA